MGRATEALSHDTLRSSNPPGGKMKSAQLSGIRVSPRIYQGLTYAQGFLNKHSPQAMVHYLAKAGYQHTAMWVAEHPDEYLKGLQIGFEVEDENFYSLGGNPTAKLSQLIDEAPEFTQELLKVAQQSQDLTTLLNIRLTPDPIARKAAYEVALRESPESAIQLAKFWISFESEAGEQQNAQWLRRVLTGIQTRMQGQQVSASEFEDQLEPGFEEQAMEWADSEMMDPGQQRSIKRENFLSDTMVRTFGEPGGINRETHPIYVDYTPEDPEIPEWAEGWPDWGTM